MNSLAKKNSVNTSDSVPQIRSHDFWRYINMCLGVFNSRALKN